MKNCSAFSKPLAGQGTALVVDPDDDEREALETLLSSADYHVLATRSTTEAIDICRDYDGAIHLLVTGLNLQGESGWELAEAASKVRPGLLVLFLSAEYMASSTGDKRTFRSKKSPQPLSTDALLEIARTLAQRKLSVVRAN